jgi:hypothetical protein
LTPEETQHLLDGNRHLVAVTLIRDNKTVSLQGDAVAVVDAA